MIGAGMIKLIGRVVFSNAGSGLAMIAACASLFLYVKTLRADLAAELARAELMTEQRDDAREAAARAVERAREAQERERETQSRLDDRLDVVRRSADVCLDQPLPGALFE